MIVASCPRFGGIRGSLFMVIEFGIGDDGEVVLTLRLTSGIRRTGGLYCSYGLVEVHQIWGSIGYALGGHRFGFRCDFDGWLALYWISSNRTTGT